jgi:hypothetical protein
VDPVKVYGALRAAVYEGGPPTWWPVNLPFVSGAINSCGRDVLNPFFDEMQAWSNRVAEVREVPDAARTCMVLDLMTCTGYHDRCQGV